jgi:hypothetical protein
MHVSALAVRHEEVAFCQLAVEVSQSEADTHCHQPIIIRIKLLERLAQIQ